MQKYESSSCSLNIRFEAIAHGGSNCDNKISGVQEQYWVEKLLTSHCLILHTSSQSV